MSRDAKIRIRVLVDFCAKCASNVILEALVVVPQLYSYCTVISQAHFSIGIVPSTIMVRYYDGVAHLEEEKRQHREAFYRQLDGTWEKKDDSTSLMTEDKWKKILEVCEMNKKASKEEFKNLAREEGYTQAFKWRSKFDVIIFGESKVLVYSEPPAPDGSFPPLESYKKPSHYGRIFDDIYAIHTAGNDHPKGRTLIERVKNKHGPSIPQSICKLFTDTCPRRWDEKEGKEDRWKCGGGEHCANWPE
jgi:hypothetical protein